MSDLLHDVLAWMEALPPFWAYCAILLIAYGENVVPPVPGDMIVVFGGYLAGVGELNFPLVVLLATVGGVLGFMTMYAIGYRIGEAVLDPGRLRWIPKAGIARARRWMHRWELGLVAANRFLSGLRSVIALTVGMAKAPAARTAVFATLSALLWTGLITYAGYKVGENWEAILIFLRDYGRIVGSTVLLAVAAMALRWYLKSKGSASEGADRGNFDQNGV